MKRSLALLALALCVLLGGCTADVWPAAPAPVPEASTGLSAPLVGKHMPSAPQGLLTVHDTGKVTGAQVTGCHSPRPDLPDPACTPGAVRDDVTQATIKTTICVPHWTEGKVGGVLVRAPTSSTRPAELAALRAYGLPDDEAAADTHEYDHLVPVELGGANDRANLWPQPGAHNAKDPVENRLKAEVCAGKISLADAQRKIASNWTLAG